MKFYECSWVDPNKFGWEKLTYWLRGYAIIDSQQSDGWFGPNLLRKSLEGEPELWPTMLSINVFRSCHQYSADACILPLLLKYFRFIFNQSDSL